MSARTRKPGPPFEVGITSPDIAARPASWSGLRGMAAPGKGRAGRELIAPHQTKWEAVLGRKIHPASVNVRVHKCLPSWEWRVRWDLFDASTRRAECCVDGTPGLVVFVENPAPSYNEGTDGILCPDQTMIEIILERFVPNLHYYRQVVVETDWDAFGCACPPGTSPTSSTPPLEA